MNGKYSSFGVQKTFTNQQEIKEYITFYSLEVQESLYITMTTSRHGAFQSPKLNQ